MKLLLYSGGDEKENAQLNRTFIELIGKKNPTITFIPSSSYLSEQEFATFVKQFKKYKVTRFIHFPVDVPFDKILFNEVMKSDAIFLDGGNTFYFLNSLRKAKILSYLKQFAEAGGVLAGLSAGAIIMTENIEMAQYPDFDRDENLVHLKNLNALNLVDFSFFPHFKNSSRYDASMKSYTRRKNKVIYGCPDGSGIAINGAEFRVIGKCHGFVKGHKFSMN